jgi:hypothetical protein
MSNPAQLKARRARLIADGMCYDCASAPAVTAGGLCQGCAERNALRNWLRYVPKRGRYGRRLAVGVVAGFIKI